jgi:hypothetical protein
MKKIGLFMFAFAGAVALYGQADLVPEATVKQFASSWATVIWGDIYPDEPFSLYSINDELIGYSFNFSIGQPFPAKEALMDECNQAGSGVVEGDRWMSGNFGSMLVSATRATAPLVRFSKVISDEYAYGLELKELAKAKLNGKDCQLYRIYIMNILAKWYCYAAGTEKVYVKVFPPVEVYTEIEFKTIALQKYNLPGLWKLPPDVNNEWQQYFSDNPIGPLVDHLIPNENQYVPFYDWSYGCTPTAFSMALAYWDNSGMTSSNDYGNLVRYHFQRWDHVQGETDKNVPDLQKALAIAMSTDSMTGNTGSCCWLIGFLNETAARGYSFTGADLYGTTGLYWAWATTEINGGRPFHMGTPGHSSTGVGYTDASQIIVHNTWWQPNDYFNIASCDLVGTIVPGGQYGAAVNITKPFGDPRYSDNATLPNQGEDLYTGDAFEITWDYDYLASSWVRLSYSTDGGYGWTYITTSTDNDGLYDWRLPSGIPGSTIGRLKVEVRDASGTEASDGSYGNFDFHAGGSLPVLSEDVTTNTSTVPDYFKFTSTANYWSVVGLRPNVSGEDWDIRLYDDENFSASLAGSSYSGSNVDYVVIDGNHSPSTARGVKASRYSGSGTTKVEFEGSSDMINPGTPVTASWPAGDVVEIWDVYLTPGYYKCYLSINSGTADLGMGLYGSAGAAYYAGRSNYLVLADAYGSGANESFTITITSTDYYGLCMFANDANSANFTLRIESAGQWQGDVSNDWFTAGNWSADFIPTNTTDVTINTGYTYYPIVGTGSAYCNNITIGAGAKISIGNADLMVSGDMTIYGQAEQTHYYADFYVNGSVYWESGSTANITDAGEFHVSGTSWEFKNGANAVLANGEVFFDGTSTQFIRSYNANNCAFNNVSNFKSSADLYFSSASSDSLKINGYYDNIYPSSTLYFNTDYPLVLKGQLYNNGHIYCPYGTFIFDGTTHTIDLNTGDYFNNVIISSTGNTTAVDSVKFIGDVTIESGALVAGSNIIQVGGNWTNNVGTAGFNEGTGKVIFNGGNYHQYCSNETFYTLEVNKTAGGAFRMNGTNVTCSFYDWSAGAVDVLPGGGSFTANDLVDNGIYGSFYLNSGGTINLTNNDGYIDLNGFLYIYGGNFNVWGGSSFDSYWPFASNAGIKMSNGTLDIKDVGVKVYNTATYSLTENITGGIIRTHKGFRVERGDYTPSGGTVEFCGPADGSLYTVNGGYVNDVIVNKGVTDISSAENSNNFYRSRENNTLTEIPMTNTISCTDVTDINGDITIQAGTLQATTSTIYLAGDWSNTAGYSGFNEGFGKVVFDGANDADILNSETFYDVDLNKSYSSYDGLELMNNVSILNDLHIIDGTMELNAPANLYITGHLTIDADAGLNANDSYGPLIYVGKNWTNSNIGYSTGFGFDPGSNSTVNFNGASDQFLTNAGTSEVFNHLVIDKSSGSFRSNNNITCYGNMDILSGKWEDNVISLLHTFYGNFTVQPSGNFATVIMPNTVQFMGSSNALLTYSSLAGYFYNLTINKASGNSVTQAGTVALQWVGSFIVEEGTYNVNGNYLNLWADAEVNAGGQLSLPAGSRMVLHDQRTMNVNSGGLLQITGTSGNPVTIESNLSSSYYYFNVNPGGTIAADYCSFKNMRPDGINVFTGATVDPSHPFRGCTFQDGIAGGTLLTINNNQTLTVRNAIFPTNTWGGASNVAKTINQGLVYFVDYSGSFAGELYDDDVFFRLTWVPFMMANATATPTSICTGNSSQLHANPSGGLPPWTYVWSPAGSLSAPFIENPVASPTVTTTYTVTVTDALGTTASSSVTLTVNSYVPVSVSIDVSQNPVPPATYVTFTATPVNGGSSPTYQWKVNGANVGTGLSTYSYIPAYGDDVWCVMTSNLPCVTGSPATSNTITMIVVPINTTVTGIVPSPLELCFDASNTITVAGGGSSFVVQSGGSAIMIAGVRIIYLPTTTVQLGGYMHGYITTSNEYCGSLPPSIITVPQGKDEEPLVTQQIHFLIYPNPTSGTFTLLQKEGQDAGEIKVELYDLGGKRMFSTDLFDEKIHTFNIYEFPAGIYILKVISGDSLETFKLIKM